MYWFSDLAMDIFLRLLLITVTGVSVLVMLPNPLAFGLYACITFAILKPVHSSKANKSAPHRDTEPTKHLNNQELQNNRPGLIDHTFHETLARTHRENQSLKTKIVGINTEVDRQNQVIQEYQKENSYLRQEVCILTDKMSSYEQELKAFSSSQGLLNEKSQELSCCEELLSDAQVQISQLANELQQAESTIQSLSEKPEGNHTVSSQTKDSDKEGLYFASEEDDLYHGERFEFLIEILTKVRSSAQTETSIGFAIGSRGKHLLDDLISHNIPQMATRDFRNNVKSAFRNSESSKLKRELRALGFVVSNANSGHLVVCPKGDKRYSIQISSTPSDRRSRMNEAHRLLDLLT